MAAKIPYLNTPLIEVASIASIYDGHSFIYSFGAHRMTNNTYAILIITYPATYPRPIAPSLSGPDTAPDGPILLKFSNKICY